MYLVGKVTNFTCFHDNQITVLHNSFNLVVVFACAWWSCIHTILSRNRVYIYKITRVPWV